MPGNKSVLVVDNEAAIVDVITETLQDEGYSVLAALAGLDALQLLQVHRPSLALIDYHLNDIDGLSLLDQIRHIDPIPIVVMTADAGIADHLERQGIARCLRKPFDLDDLIACVAHYADRAR